MSTNSIRLTTLLFFLSISLLLFAQKQVKVSGYIFNQKQEPIESAHIYNSLKQEGTTSDKAGFFELSIPGSDTTVLIFTCIGYEKKMHTFLPSAKDHLIEIRLNPGSAMLEDIQIVQKRQEPNAFQKINIAHAKHIADPSGNGVEALLTTLPGVTSHNELSSQYTVRGGNFDENAVYINGTEIYRPLLIRSGQQEGLSVINPDLVEDVRFSSGGFDSRYGDKVSSVLDIRYKQPKAFEAGFTASLMGASAYIGSQHKNFSQIHGIRFKKNTSLLNTLDDKGEYDPSFLDYQTHMALRINQKLSVSFMGQLARNTYSFRPRSRNTCFGNYLHAKSFKVYFSGNEKDIFQNLLASTALNYKLNELTNLRVRASLYNTLEEENYDISGKYWLSNIDADGTESELTGTGSYHEHARNRLQTLITDIEHSGDYRISNSLLEWGIMFKREHIKDRIKEWKMQDSSGYSLPSSLDRVNVSYHMKARNSLVSNRANAYVQNRINWENGLGNWSLTAGARFSYWNYNREFLFSPRVNLRFTPEKNPDLHLRFATGVYHQSPFYKEYRDTINRQGDITVMLNKHIKAQRSFQLIAGSDLDFHIGDSPFRFTSEIYYKALDRIIPYEVNNIKITYAGENLGRGYSTGVDLKLYGEFIPEADSWIALSFMKSEERINNKWYPRPMDQRVNLSMFFQDYFPNNPKYRFHLKGIIGSGLIVYSPGSNREAGSFRSPPYKRVDCGVSRELINGEDKIMQKPFFRAFRSLWIGLDFFNIFNFRNVNSYYWVADIRNHQYAVPNYLTSFQINLKLSASF